MTVDNNIDSSIQVVIFDHDDTLVSTMQAKWAQHKYIAKEFYDKVLTDEELKKHWGKPLTMLVQLLYETDHIDVAMSYNIATRNLFPKRLFSDTLLTLENLRKMGKKIGLVTATTTSSLEHDFQTLHIPKHLFDYIQTEDATAVHKPDPRVFEPTLSWLKERQIKPEEVVYVGDHLNDMKAALGVGFRFIGVGTGIVSLKEFSKNTAKTISKLSDLLG